VYLASHELLKRPAVIKVVRPDRMGRDTLARFEREAQITSTLRHPNSIAVYDYGLTEDGAPFYVMEHLDGIDLDRLVKRFGPLPQERVVYLLRQLCGSLAEAHAAQLIHRDIKPANLFVCRHRGAADLLKVLDFGIARTLEPGQQGATESRTVLGTPAYMAPELFESGQNISPASDLYAVGCVAYFLLTGQHVFEAVSAHDMGMAHVMERPLPPSARCEARIDPQLDALVLACLAKRRDGRPHSVTLLRALLDSLPCAFHWTESQAETWWKTRAQEVDALQAEHVESDTQRIHDPIRPRRHADVSAS
jgi:serine/threonine protein kinase